MKRSFCSPACGTMKVFDRLSWSSKRARVTNASQTCSVVTENPKAQSEGGTACENERLYNRAQFVAEVLLKELE